MLKINPEAKIKLVETSGPNMVTQHVSQEQSGESTFKCCLLCGFGAAHRLLTEVHLELLGVSLTSATGQKANRKEDKCAV